MNTQHTFWTLLKKYDKIEVPIIQRDYAQGRDSLDAERIRNKFVNQYLIESLTDKKAVELDFVYGSILESENGKSEKKLFIPLDGQQRLTTLFLLHWFIAVKEGRLEEVNGVLSKFTYETRPSAHDFCEKLMSTYAFNNIKNIREEIIDTDWFDDEWSNDPTITGMLVMLQTFAGNDKLLNHPHELLDVLLLEKNPLISFYFIPLEKFGLTENLYIRMNARGKMLTDFENFKSEFYKVIGNHHDLLEIVKNKIEYEWVEQLWTYKEQGSYVVDKPFMHYLNFISEMLYFKDADYRAERYENNFVDLTLLKKIYSKEDNIKFLVFALDKVTLLANHKEKLLWVDQSKTIDDFIKSVLDGKRDGTQYLLVYSALRYYYNGKSGENFSDYIRVVRNLIHNTPDKSIREWPRLMKSLSNLISDSNTYSLLLQDKFFEKLEGFSVSQRNEEIAKAEILTTFPESRKIIFEAEDNFNLQGNINSLLMTNFVSTYKQMKNFDWSTTDMQRFNTKKLKAVLKSYEAVSKNDFREVWAELLTTEFYDHVTWQSRLYYANDYKRHPSMILLALEYNKSPNSTTLDAFLQERQRRFVKKINSNHSSLAMVRNVKEQLYIYYIIHIRVMKGKYWSFFKNGYNFGWLKKQKGFSSIFTDGIKDDIYFRESNPIFQTFSSQFRFNLGLKEKSSLNEETVGNGRKNNPFDALLKWVG